MSDYDIVQTMRQLGGSFVQALAAAWLCADSQNQARIKLVWPELFSKYRELAERQATQGQTHA